jgi:hypothetical protein
MEGLDTIMRDGLDLAATITEPAGSCQQMAELLQWHDVTDALPDADTTVLMWVCEADGSTDWYAGWWDGEAWQDAANGGPVAGRVSHWAEPEGPTA